MNAPSNPNIGHPNHEVLATGERAFHKVGGPELLPEALVLSTVESSHIPRLLASYQDQDGRWHVVQELKEGESLKGKVGLSDSWENSPLLPDEAVDLMGEVVKPFRALHRHNILYKDLNFDHLIIDEKGKVHLIDHEADATKNLDGKWLSVNHNATWETMAPEEFEEEHGTELSEATNTYTLGVIFAQLIGGTPPFYVGPDSGADDASRKAEMYRLHKEGKFDLNNIPPNFRPVVEKALAPAQEDRYQTVDEFIAAVRSAGVASAVVSLSTGQHRSEA